MALARNFPGKDEAWLRAKLDATLEDIAAAKMTISSGAGDVNGSFSRESSLEKLKALLCFDLWIVTLDPQWLTDAGVTERAPKLGAIQ